MDDFFQLRALLLQEEQDELKALKRQVKMLDENLRTPEFIIEQFSPLLSKVLKRSQQYNKEALLESLSPLISELVDRRYENSKDDMAKQMAPIVSAAMREQIKNQKDEVVDALYPVLGSVISRYVAKTFESMMENINHQVQQGLSIKNISRRLKAKIKGVSETELILRENAHPNIHAVFLIHKTTGIVLAHTDNPNNPINEPEMVSSMLTAIKSFVNDWIAQNTDHQELGEIEYGGNKICIESSGYVYLATILEGSANLKTTDTMNEILEHISVQHGDAIRAFNGDLDALPHDALYKKIATLLTYSDGENIKKSSKLIPSALLILIFGTIGYFGYKSYIDTQLTHAVNLTLHKTPQLTVYRIDAVAKNYNITLTGNVPSEFHKSLAQIQTKKILDVKKINNQLMVVELPLNPTQISEQITTVIEHINQQKNIQLNYKFSYPNLFLSGNTWKTQTKEKALTQLNKIAGIKSIDEKISIVAPPLSSQIYFAVDSAKISDTEKKKLNEISKKFSLIDKKFSLLIQGYSDNTGTVKKNLKLAKSRANNVKNYLTNILNIKQTTYIADSGMSVIIHNAAQLKNARRVSLLWKK